MIIKVFSNITFTYTRSSLLIFIL